MAPLLRWRHLILGLSVCLMVCLGPVLASSSTTDLVPAAKPHPLPAALAAWQDSTQAGDYFDQVKKTRVGYLIWSQFPIKVYIGPATAPTPNADLVWSRSVQNAVQQWQAYLPLVVTDQRESADIIIEQLNPKRRSGERVRSAETRYQLYVNSQRQLVHRSTVTVRPNQTEPYIAAAVRHELGHALGIWGHSESPSDALYFSQVRTPPDISARDINTLKRVYQQPTRLGWSLQPQAQPSAAQE